VNFLVAIYHTTRFWIIVVFLSLVLGALAILGGVIDSTGNLSHRISSLWSRCLCRWNGIQVEVEGMEHVQTDHAQIFIANHQSFFDIFSLSGFLPVQIRWMAKSSLFKIPFVGWSMVASRYIPVERESRKKAYQAFVQAVEKLKAGYSVVIFPEGTRSLDGTIGPFKKGSHLLAVRSKAPLVPVTIMGSGNIKRKGSMWIEPGRVRIIISPPLNTEKIGNQDEEAVLSRIRKTICDNYEKFGKQTPREPSGENGA